MILSGKVFSGEVRIDKPGTPVSTGNTDGNSRSDHPWVSRGGLKLDHALDCFKSTSERAPPPLMWVRLPADLRMFCCRAVRTTSHAVDVGYGQLPGNCAKTRGCWYWNSRNARGLTADDIPAPVGAVVCDASFTRLETVLPAPMGFAGPGAHLIALIKPQFEVAKSDVGQGGIVRDARTSPGPPAVGSASGWPVWTAGRSMAPWNSPITGARAISNSSSPPGSTADVLRCQTQFARRARRRNRGSPVRERSMFPMLPVELVRDGKTCVNGAATGSALLCGMLSKHRLTGYQPHAGISRDSRRLCRQHMDAASTRRGKGPGEKFLAAPDASVDAEAFNDGLRAAQSAATCPA